jgi:hypothetical protein
MKKGITLSWRSRRRRTTRTRALSEMRFGSLITIRTASKAFSKDIENARSLQVLTNSELGDELETESQIGASCHPDRKGSFSIGESTQVGIQPSLLIVRFTCRFFTAHGSQAMTSL